MDRLEDDFGSQVEFRRIDADTRAGQTAFRSYSLRGHPSYVMLDPRGTVLWIGLGEQSRQALMDQINLVLMDKSD